ncbi:MAG TPA: sensor histidine kinase [Vicinamibacterales bacterium]
MPTGRAIPALVRIALAASAIWLAAFPAAAQGSQKQVLALFSTRRDVRIALLGNNELPRGLEAGLQQPVDFYSEYLDAARFADPAYPAAFRDFLRVKYRDKRFDVVISVQDVATSFAERFRGELWPDTPLVFYVTSAPDDRPANATGVVASPDFAATVTLATTLQPDTERVFTVSGASERDRANQALVRAQFRRFEPRLEVIDLSSLPAPLMDQRLAALPPHSIVFYTLFYQDRAGQNFNPVGYLDRVAAVSNRPVYSWVDTAIGHGVVGGSLRSLEAIVTAISERAVRVLRGESADHVPMLTASLQTPQVDWRQLQRWGISESRVPPGTTILFRTPGVWEHYRGYILAAMALLLAQSVLIGALLIQAARRRRAERQLQASETELRASYERIRDLGGRLLRAQEDERARISRELHDDISQQIAVLGIDLAMLEASPPRGGEQLVSEAYERTQAVARRVRDLSHRLHPSNLALIGLSRALERLARDFANAGLTITFTHGDLPDGLPTDVTLCLFRVAQEALQNIVKHSGARAATMHLETVRGEVWLTIADEGTGFELRRAGRGLGLISMEERVDQIGGTLRVRSTPGSGTAVYARVPIRGAQRETTVA